MDEVSPILNREPSGTAFQRLVKTGAPAPISALAAGCPGLRRSTWRSTS